MFFDMENINTRTHTAIEVPPARGVSWAPLPWAGKSLSVSTQGTPEEQFESRKASLESAERCISMNRLQEELETVIDLD